MRTLYSASRTYVLRSFGRGGRLLARVAFWRPGVIYSSGRFSSFWADATPVQWSLQCQTGLPYIMKHAVIMRCYILNRLERLFARKMTNFEGGNWH